MIMTEPIGQTIHNNSLRQLTHIIEIDRYKNNDYYHYCIVMTRYHIPYYIFMNIKYHIQINLNMKYWTSNVDKTKTIYICIYTYIFNRYIQQIYHVIFIVKYAYSLSTHVRLKPMLIFPDLPKAEADKISPALRLDRPLPLTEP